MQDAWAGVQGSSGEDQACGCFVSTCGDYETLGPFTWMGRAQALSCKGGDSLHTGTKFRDRNDSDDFRSSSCFGDEDAIAAGGQG